MVETQSGRRDSRLDIQFDPVNPVGKCPRRDLTDIGEYHEDNRDGSEDTSSRYTMFSSHFVFGVLFMSSVG